ncbi:MAG TPA: response regulator [Trebonia sp.]|nr:response regulator [Trebonia sp.]
MSSDQISAVAQLLGVFTWPAVLVFVFVQFRAPLTELIKNAGQLSLKGAGFEASITRQREDAVAALGAAVATKAGPGGAEAPPSLDEVVSALPSPRAQQRIQDSSVLWVDDHPGNNNWERQALEALGIRVDISTSTEDALARIRWRPYDLIISDMGRPPDARAGYTLLDQLRASGDPTPYVIYASSRAPEHIAEARQHGVIGCTNSAIELVKIVTAALSIRR